MAPQYSIQKVAQFHGHKGPVYDLLPSYRPGHLLSSASEGIVAEWNLETEEATAIAQSPGPIFSMCIIPERNLLLLGLESGDILFTDLKTRKTLRRVQLHKKAVFNFLPLPDGQTVLASGADGALSLWNLDQLDHIHYQAISKSSVRSLVLHPNGNQILSGSSDQQIRVFDLGLNLLKSWKAHELSVFRLAFSQDGSTLLSTGRDAHLCSWDVNADYQLLHSVPAHTYTVNDIALPTDPGIAFTGSMDKSIKMWRIDDLKLLKVCSFEKNQCHRNGINRLLWWEDSLFSTGDDKVIMRWKFEEEAP